MYKYNAVKAQLFGTKYSLFKGNAQVHDELRTKSVGRNEGP